MEKLNFKKTLALLICAIAMSAAAASTSLCIVWWFNECKMPKSLYKFD
jgi:hypothetical protein